MKQWQTADPFLFCVHHVDAYPPGNEKLGPSVSLAGRNIGQDFADKDGWNMYHGDVVPGFPQHPHRGFETVTILRSGYIDHSDSLGASARFGPGDVQWLTAGEGIVHCEMFPLLERDKGNPLELFQIWLNLPKADKLVAPHFTMLWERDIPRVQTTEGTEVTVIAGELAGKRPPPPPPHSWASRPESDLAIWTIAMKPRATWTLPPANAETIRALYAFRGTLPSIEEGALLVTGDEEVKLESGDAPVELLLLQGRPLREPIAQHGPFVMNTEAEIHQAVQDYRRTRFGGWPWPSDAPVFPRDAGRFAKQR